MTYKEFTELKKYRVCCEWDESLKICSKDSAFIPFTNYKGYVYYHNDELLGVMSFGKDVVGKLLSQSGVEYTCFGDEGTVGEIIYTFNAKDLDKVGDMLNLKTQPKNKVSPFSNRNINIYLRIMRNVCKEKYDKLLKEHIKSK